LVLVSDRQLHPWDQKEPISEYRSGHDPVWAFTSAEVMANLDYPWGLDRFGCHGTHWQNEPDYQGPNHSHPTSRSASFAAARTSHSSMTRAMSMSDHSVFVTPAAIAGG
jgi:hypothetical protein